VSLKIQDLLYLQRLSIHYGPIHLPQSVRVRGYKRVFWRTSHYSLKSWPYLTDYLCTFIVRSVLFPLRKQNMETLKFCSTIHVTSLLRQSVTFGTCKKHKIKNEMAANFLKSVSFMPTFRLTIARF